MKLTSPFVFASPQTLPNMTSLALGQSACAPQVPQNALSRLAITSTKASKWLRSRVPRQESASARPLSRGREARVMMEPSEASNPESQKSTQGSGEEKRRWWARSGREPLVSRGVSNALKWLAGISTILTVTHTTLRLDEAYNGDRESSDAAAQLVELGDLALENQDFKAAWESYEKALQADANSEKAIRQQAKVAMIRCRNPGATHADSVAPELAEKFIPAIYRVLSTAKGETRGEMTAHMAWCKISLIGQGKATMAQVSDFFDDALSQAPKGPYANTLKGIFELRSRSSLVGITERFRGARERAPAAEQPELLRLQVGALWNGGGPKRRDAALEILDQAARKDTVLSKAVAQRVLRHFAMEWRDGNVSKTAELLSPVKSLRVLRYLRGAAQEALKLSDRQTLHYQEAKLEEALGNYATALRMLNELQREISTTPFEGLSKERFEQHVESAVQRVGERVDAQLTGANAR